MSEAHICSPKLDNPLQSKIKKQFLVLLKVMAEKR